SQSFAHATTTLPYIDDDLEQHQSENSDAKSPLDISRSVERSLEWAPPKPARSYTFEVPKQIEKSTSEGEFIGASNVTATHNSSHLNSSLWKDDLKKPKTLDNFPRKKCAIVRPGIILSSTSKPTAELSTSLPFSSTCEQTLQLNNISRSISNPSHVSCRLAPQVTDIQEETTHDAVQTPQFSYVSRVHGVSHKKSPKTNLEDNLKLRASGRGVASLKSDHDIDEITDAPSSNVEHNRDQSTHSIDSGCFVYSSSRKSSVDNSESLSSCSSITLATAKPKSPAVTTESQEWSSYLVIPSDHSDTDTSNDQHSTDENAKRRNSLVVRTQTGLRVKTVIDKLLNSSGRDQRRALFSLKQIFQDDKDLVHEFVQNGGLNCMIKLGRMADQNHQNYILRALGQVMLYVDGMNGIIAHIETIQWLYELLDSPVGTF
ncbi:unnamed protein product, partial [Anisakis simplex]|uniref:Formactin (inferred by orthology to a C. elegans protein) n=1 Tax=Anisakis simplex TaxID=6269 RepID=A0A0M3J2M3_ANISI